MCVRTECPKCLRPTYAGCGAHVEQVLGDVPADQRCTCRTDGTQGQGQKLGDKVGA
jgi:hypothetical protein